MEAVPARARACAAAAAALAALCALPLPAGTPTPWGALVLLVALYALCDQVVRRRFGGTFYPVLLAGAFLLPPAAAALVPL
ncbi:metal-dependent phosphohydrolase, partial [Streptomyces sp. SID4982]|nr:metal-dependent phosphohydrolase [Streptomyces sp. SID4982]